jgi:peptidoglycan-associated lipoprotein
MIQSRLRVAALSLLLGACGGKAANKHAIPAPQTPSAQPSAGARPAAVPASPNIGVADDLAKQCGLRFANLERAPKFGFDDAELLPADREVLQQVAECLIRGPLRGRAVELVGRADPRGTDEYNLGLGSQRAQSVRLYLQRLGVSPSQMSATTRGEVDATGTNEPGWQQDRRVDLQLVN